MKQSKARTTLILTLFIVALSSTVIFARQTAALAPLQTIYIQSDGSISPSNVPIQRNGDTYTLIGDIYAAIKIERGNIVLDGAGYTLSGPYNGSSAGVWVVGAGPDQNASTAEYVIGVDTTEVDGITVENLNVRNFSIGMYMWTKNNTVVGNAVSNCSVGILLSGSNTKITGNYISDNKMGLFFGFNTPGDIPYDITISQNSFQSNIVQLQGCQCKVYNFSEPIHNWDNGKEGNYWSDYNGTDANNDNLGDTPYTVDPLDQDRYPLMANRIQPPTPAVPQGFPVFPIITGVSIAAVVTALVFALHRKKNCGVPK